MNCEFQIACGFLTMVGRNQQPGKGWQRMYCGSERGKSQCERLKALKATGHMPPDNFMPNGLMYVKPRPKVA
jgi:hypothetical protein